MFSFEQNKDILNNMENKDIYKKHYEIRVKMKNIYQ